jgi:hypothetical protein
MGKPKKPRQRPPASIGKQCKADVVGQYLGSQLAWRSEAQLDWATGAAGWELKRGLLAHAPTRVNASACMREADCLSERSERVPHPKPSHAIKAEGKAMRGYQGIGPLQRPSQEPLRREPSFQGSNCWKLAAFQEL